MKFAAARAVFGRAAFLFVLSVDTVIDSSMPMSYAMRHILAQQFKRLRALEQAVRAAQSVEAVHDMRVACRRLKSAFRLGRGYLPDKRVEKLLPVLDLLRESLGAARNSDVLAAALSVYRTDMLPPDNATLNGLAEAWTRARAEQQDALEQLLNGSAYAEWTTRMAEFLDESAIEPSPRVVEKIPALLWKQYGIVRAYETRRDDANMATLHTLRIEVKRLRYALEFFREPLTAPGDISPRPNELIEALIALQDLLGEMQDAVVGSEWVTRYLISQTAHDTGNALAPEFHALAGYRNFLRAQIEARRGRVPELYIALTSPWFRESLGVVTARF